jgi:hypothetical protein
MVRKDYTSPLFKEKDVFSLLRNSKAFYGFDKSSG